MQLLKPGTLFAGGRYEIVRTISAGGMGVVYEALHRDTRRHRALKVMLPQALLDDDLRARFSREGVVTAGIESEHLVEVFDIGIDEETRAPFLVMELLRGEDLGARLGRRERTSPSELLEIFEQICRALARTHAAGVVHRDLKPENLFVTHREDGSLRMRILDFGIAKVVDSKESKNTRSIGTPLYMAPEQMTGKSAHIGPHVDIYALGQIAFTLLAGAPYFQREAEESPSALALMLKVSGGTLDPASERGRDAGVELPAAFDAWFLRATSLDPKARHRTTTELMTHLRSVLAGAPEQLPQPVSPRRMAALMATEPIAPPAEGSGAFVEAQSVSPNMGSSAPGKVASETAPSPSSRTLSSQQVRRPSPRVGVVFGGIAILAAGAGLYSVTRAPSSSRAEHEPVASPSVAAASAGVADPTPEPRAAQPDVTPGGSVTQLDSGAPSDSGASSSGASSSGAPSGTASAKPAASAATPRPRVTAQPTATTAPAATASPAPTVWQGPRR